VSAQPPAPDPRPTLLVLGPFLMDRVRLAGAGPVAEHPGGNGLVVACVAARLGWPTRLVAQLAEDPLGQRLAGFVEDAGVTLRRQPAPAGLETKRADIVVDPDGPWRTVATHPARYPYLCPPADSEALDGCGAVVITGLCSLWRSCPDAVEAWIAAARAAGVPVTFGLNRLEAHEGALVERLIGPDDRLFCNSDEACAWLGVEAGGLAPALAAARGGDLVVSLGADGVLLRPAGEPVVHLPVEPESVVSSVGAGDVLCATTSVRLLEGRSLLDAVTAGQHAASRSVGFPRWDGG